MRNKTTVVVNGNSKEKLQTKFFITIILTVLTVILCTYTIRVIVINNKFAEEVNEFYKLNAKTVFSINKIYMYSSASAVQNKETRPVWNLNLFEFTDIAIYINNRSDEYLNNENTIKQMYIDNIKFGDPKLGEQSLYYKDINEFGKSIIKKNEETSSGNEDDNTNNINNNSNKLENRVDFTILNDGDLDYSKPQIFADCSNPITFEYVNENIKKNQIISDITANITYDGSILRKCSVVLSDISSYVSFNVNIVNNYNQKFVANVYIEIPLEDTVTGDTIYNGRFVKKIENKNEIKFFRIQ